MWLKFNTSNGEPIIIVWLMNNKSMLYLYATHNLHAENRYYFFFTNYYQFEGIKTKRSYTRRNEMAHIVQLTHYYYISKWKSI